MCTHGLTSTEIELKRDAVCCVLCAVERVAGIRVCDFFFLLLATGKGSSFAVAGVAGIRVWD